MLEESTMRLMEYLAPFVIALTDQLEQDQERWGNEWKKRPIEPTDGYLHQNIRISARIGDYYREWKDDDTPIPWLKVAGLAFIGWVRETYPDTYMLRDDEDD